MESIIPGGIDLHKYIPEYLFKNMVLYQNKYRDRKNNFSLSFLTVLIFQTYYDNILKYLLRTSNILRSIKTPSDKEKLFKNNLIQKINSGYATLKRHKIKGKSLKKLELIEE
jgi:hypothetical protein